MIWTQLISHSSKAEFELVSADADCVTSYATNERLVLR
jgi:hypothetical protein